MSILLVADIHSNLDALTAVLADAERRGPLDAVWCLGDLVGYGPDPSACIALIKEGASVCLAGNHDLAAVGVAPITLFSGPARIACAWTATQLSDDEAAWLSGLSPATGKDACTLVHASPRDPIWEYVISPGEAVECLKLVETPLCLIGHTHIPSVFYDDGTAGLLYPDQVVEVPEQGRMLFNPGSVGQPRDGDPRAAYALYDPGLATLTHHRVEYDIPAVQERMARVDLPPYLISRLARGR